MTGCLSNIVSHVVQVVGRLDEVSDEVLEFFEPAAQIVMASADPRKAMAAALATLSGITERPKSRSLLTQVCSHSIQRSDAFFVSCLTAADLTHVLSSCMWCLAQLRLFCVHATRVK